MLVVAGAQAQVSLPPDINFFGGNLPQPSRNGNGTAEKAPAAAGYGQVLVFGDGHELRGELMEVTREEILWRRPDAGETLRFPRSEVRRVVTGAAKTDVSNGLVPGEAGNPPTPANPPADRATLKLPGGDWLFGKVTSTDGQRFLVQLNEGTQLPISRAQIEWMHFGATPVPAFGFSGSALDMEGWLPANATMELVGQTLTVKGASWIGRSIAPPNRFEISFELPEESEEGTRLWLQPFGPQPNCFGTGTAEIRFGRSEIAHMLAVDKFDSESMPLPAEALKEKGPVKYRVLYDGTARRMIVQRNARIVGDWKYFDEKDPPANGANTNFQFSGICFDRENRGDGATPLKFNRLRIEPWNGALPQGGESRDDQDRLSVAEAAEVAGKLESVRDKELEFSGTSHPREAGTMVRFFGPAPAVLTGAEAKLEFGSEGEFIARNLQVHEGKVHCETSFSSALELPLNTLQIITFQAPVTTTQSPSASMDTLVFKNADELPGKALSASQAGPVRWRTTSGQEVEFQSTRIAGLRLAGAVQATDPKAAVSSVTVELRSGERLRGQMVGFDEKHLQLQHPLLGSIGLDRSRLWHLFPTPRFEAVDGVRSPGGWAWNGSGENHPAGENATRSDRCVYLDGTYVLRGHGYSGSFNFSDMPGLQRTIDSGLERFEIRVDAAGVDNSPNFMLSLADPAGNMLRVTVGYGSLQLSVQHTTGRRRSPWRNIPLSEKLGNANSQRDLRLFVDTRTGTSDLVINGVHIIRLGQDEVERLPPAQYTAKIQPYPNQGMSSVFSNIWMGPWNGELPSSAKAADESTALSNGDLAKGAPMAMHDGKFTIDSDLGELDIPVEKALAVDFGGAVDGQKIAARFRLGDGTVLNVDRFHWDGQELTAHSPTLGDLRLPGGVVSELIYDPSPVHAPTPVGANKLAQKDPGEPTHN